MQIKFISALAAIATAAFGITALAQSQSDISCIAAAVEKREIATISAYDKQTRDSKSELEARLAALKAAFAISDKKERKTAVKTARIKFRNETKHIRREFNEAKRAAWNQFKYDRKACGRNVSSEEAGSHSDDSFL